MSIDHLLYSLGLAFPGLIGILTIFGRKKNEKPADGNQPDTVLPTSSTITDISHSEEKEVRSASNPEKSDDKIVSSFSSDTEQQQSGQVEHTFHDEETSLNKLLQSLMQDLPASGLDSSAKSGPEIPATPDYVPLRATPPSRPMVIDSKGTSMGLDEEELKEEVEVKPATSPRYTKPAETPVAQGKVQSTPGSVKGQEVEKQSKQEKPDKPERLEKPTKQALKKEIPARQDFNHIFQLTQGNLESAGLVIVNGSSGSGKTTLCSALADNYMKMGNPCLYVTYDQSPSALRDQMKALGGDPGRYESQFRFILVDGFSSQSDSFSMEPYYVEQPFDFGSIQDVLARNAGIFSGDKIRIVFDSMDKIAAKGSQKDFAKRFGELAGKMRDLGATFVVTVDLSKLAKDTVSSLEDAADCLIDIVRDSDDPDTRDLKVRKLNKSFSKIEPETFQVETGKGLVFV